MFASLFRPLSYRSGPLRRSNHRVPGKVEIPCHVPDAHLLQKHNHAMDQTVCVTLLARGKGDILIGVTAAGGTLQAVDAHDEHLVFLTYVHTAEMTVFAPIENYTARIAMTATLFIRTFAKIMNNFITFVISLGALVAFQTKCMIDIAGIHICSVFVDTKIMDFQLFSFYNELLYHTIWRMSHFSIAYIVLQQKVLIVYLL